MTKIAISQECNHTLKGTVKDFHDGSPISEAAIRVEGLQTYAITDTKGNFVLKNLCATNIKLIVSHVSCETKVIGVNLTKIKFKEIRLEHHIEELNEVTIKTVGNKRTKTAQETILKTNVIDRYSSLSLGDAIREIPGVSSINTGNAIVKPVINGLHSSRVLIMTNNVRLQDQEWGIEHAPNIDVNTAGSISLIKGANALEFGGDAIGGVIVVNPERVYKKDSIFGKTILNGQNNGRGYGFHTGLTKSYANGLYVNGTGTYRKSGDYKAPNYSLTNTGNQLLSFALNLGIKKFEYGYSFQYSYLKNEIAILRSSHIGNVEDLINAINSQQPLFIDRFSYNIDAPKQEVTHQIFKIDFYKRFKDLGKLNVQYDYQNNHRFEFDIRVGEDRDKAAIDLELSTHTLKSTLKLDTHSNNNYKLGFVGSYQDNFANPDTGVRRLIPDYIKYDLGLFALGEFAINESTNLELGMRYDFNRINAKKFYIESRWLERGYEVDFADIILQDFGTQLLVNPKFNYHNLSVSAGVNYQMNDNNTFLFNYGLSNRPPNPSELFSDGLHHSAARIELGELRMEKETSNRISSTYIHKSQRIQLNIESFFNHIHNFIYLEPSGVETTIRGSFPVWEYKQVNAILFGLDTDFQYTFANNWRFQNKASFIKGKDVSSKRPLIDIPSFKTMNVLRYTNPKLSQLNLELQSEWVFRQNEFPNNNFEAFIPRTNSFETADISTPPTSYHLMNFRGEVGVKLSKNSKMKIAITVNNLFDTSYREYLNRVRYFADDLGRNVMLQLKFNY